MKGISRIARRGFLAKSATAMATMAATTFAAALPAPGRAVAKWDRETDVIVIGSGIAGICAAIEAANAGSEVVVLEKDAQPGGCAKFSGGHITVAGTHLEASAKVEDHPDWLYDDMMADSEMVAVPELIRKYVDSGPEHIVWLEHLGLRFSSKFQDDSNTDRIKPGIGRGHMIAESPDYPGGPHQGGLGLVIMLLRAAEKHGVSPLLQHKMNHLIRSEGHSSVLGVEAASGHPYTIKARRAVIVATGGWSGNPRMALAEDPRITEDIYPDCWPYHLCLGEGHLAAVDVGAELSNMSFGGYLVPRWGTRVYQIWEPPTLATVPSIHTGVAIPDFQHVMIVDNAGKRFVNEKLGDPQGVPLPGNPKFSFTPSGFPNHPFIEAYLDLPQRPRNAWALTDQAGAGALGWLEHAEELGSPNPKTGLALYPGMTAVADTLAQLARQMNIDPVRLQSEVARYNGFADAGADHDFGKPELGRRIEHPPFYAARMALVKHTRRNGIRVNTRGQVLDRTGLLNQDNPTRHSIDDEQAIPRLYAAGECVHYLGRSHGHGTLGIYSFYGRVAGRNAATEAKLS